ncbi:MULTISPECIES: AI-2E family transporter [Rhizobium/Agrobacterium group]|uniref:AI-2E family transporter n=1 Tax=Rhizobium/Agrobacterium group TaxID=227290 RepID=UPI002301A023|nr:MULTISPECIES: AI-2E family transporter [Rhizobium/Agrobacterium group]MDA5636001.1 AI-2E family transporter [Agrobacterium sp. ST15.16.024]MDF1891089.1 AI-2E family transporter [Rhizobium rhizogenes]
MIPTRSVALTSPTLSGRTIIILIGVAVILYVGQEVFIPLALALLLTFMLAPIVSFLRKRRVPKIAAVLMAVASAFLVIAAFGFIVAGQVANLADNVPTYQRNIVAKAQALSHAGSGNGILEHISKVVERIGSEMQDTAEESKEDGAAPSSKRDPMPVEIVTRSNPIQTLGNFILPLISPFATAGLVIVLVVFMLLEREELRDRFIRLVGLGDLHRTTAALQDAGKRVGKYLLMQLVVNTLYALPIAIGLWLLGIPNAILWGLLTLVLRFVPYIGPVIGMILPLFLALAIAPGWSLVAWVAALFIITELASNNVVEPWLYGSHTGLSPLAIIVSAIFWSWLWGPVGLMLSTPLTVCLVVLGRYVPQFSFLDVLLGNEPVLQPQEKLYQRLLAGDPNEATDNAEDFLEAEYLLDYYEQVGFPALKLGEMDRQRGVMTEAQIALFASTTQTLIGNLAEIAIEEQAEQGQSGSEAAALEEATENPEMPDVKRKSVLCIGGRGAMDDAAASMIAQVLAVQGATASQAEHSMVSGTTINLLRLTDIDTVVIAFLNAGSKAHARQAVRRLKRQKPSLRVGIVIPGSDGERESPVAAEDIDADFVATGIADAARGALSDGNAVAIRATKRIGRSRERKINPLVA